MDERRAQIIHERELEKKWSQILNPLNADELEYLNGMIVHRLRIMDRLASLSTLSHLKIGDQVKWSGSDGRQHTGKIMRLNMKTATILADNSAAHWRVSPGYLEKI